MVLSQAREYPHACAQQYSTEYSWQTLCRYAGFSLCIALFSLILSSKNSNLFGLPRLLVLSPQHRKLVRLCLRTFPLCMLWKLYQGIKAGALCFLSLRDYFPSLLNVQDLENCRFMFMSAFLGLLQAGGLIWSLLFHLGWKLH